MANGDDFMKTLYLAHDHLKNIRFIFKFWICTYNTRAIPAAWKQCTTNDIQWS